MFLVGGPFFFFPVKPGDPHTPAHSYGCPVPPPTGDTDVFGATSVPSLKEPQKPEQPAPRKSPYPPAPAGLFDDEDDDDDFFAASSSKPSKTGTWSSLFFWEFSQGKNVDRKRA